MAHIFLSYTSKDRQLAERVAKLLEALGFEVWWEPKILPGMSWQDAVARALQGMDCMVVLWSRDSAENDLVREQAEEGRRRRVLLPVLADKISPPVGFRDINCLDFSDWDGSGDAPGIPLFAGGSKVAHRSCEGTGFCEYVCDVYSSRAAISRRSGGLGGYRRHWRAVRFDAPVALSAGKNQWIQPARSQW